jgi:hypothetical protein
MDSLELHSSNPSRSFSRMHVDARRNYGMSTGGSWDSSNPQWDQATTALSCLRLTGYRPVLARHVPSRKVYRLAAVGPEGRYILGWVEGRQAVEQLDPTLSEWIYIGPVGGAAHGQ